ncbi:hypothetical protein V1506DRAFT_534567 [Lipomyces tetrasporus]
MAPLPEHVLIRPLGFADLDQVVKLESHTFPSNERAGRERMRYRLHAAPELSSGMFVRVPSKKGRCIKKDCSRAQRSRSSDSASSTSSDSSSGSSSSQLPALSFRRLNGSLAEDIEDDDEINVTACPRSREKLIAFVIGTKCAGEYISDDALAIPEVDKQGHRKTTEGNDRRGHVETGNTIAIESICVDPDYQGMKLGTTILRDFVQRMSTQAVAERITLLARDDMIPFYENLGFYNAGSSTVKFGGGGWNNLWMSLEDGEVDD